MTNEELTLYNIGENLDSLMTLDPRGYGVCRILYRAARDYAGEPLSVHAAKGLVAHIHSGDLVYIITGFVLLPWKQPETDGMVSSMMLARFLIKAFDCTPVLVVPEECMEAVRRLAMVLGFHLYDTVEEAGIPVLYVRRALYQGRPRGACPGRGAAGKRRSGGGDHQ